MSVNFLNVPYLGVNDDECELVEWHVDNGERVTEGQIVCTVETTKTAISVEAHGSGYIYTIENSGERLKVNTIIAILSETQLDEEEINKITRGIADLDNKAGSGITKKAEAIAKKNNIDISDLVKMAGGERITEKIVLEFIETRNSLNYSRGFCAPERVVIIGGVSGGGALIIIDSLMRSRTQQPVAILDQDESFHGKSIMGVPVVGPLSFLDQLHTEERVDSVAIAFNKNLQQRAEVFENLKERGISFANIIDETSNIRSKVKMGEGNVILGNVYIGACSEIGNNNFISSNVCLEHGNILGSHCAFGPGVFTSGNVKIGDQVRFGTGIYVEPNIEIKNNAIISSGAILRDIVPQNSVVRVNIQQEIKSM